MQRLLLRIIYYYQRFISPLYPPCCRFYPSCSIYTAEAIQSFGVITGTYIGLKRVCRCHPFCKGGFDPVPDQEE